MAEDDMTDTGRVLDGPRFGPVAGGAPRLLVVICHGYGATGDELIPLATPWSEILPHALFVAPNAPDRLAAGLPGGEWFPLEACFPLGEVLPDSVLPGARRAARLLDAWIDAELAALDLPPEACVLSGFSQGAMTALFTGLRRAAPPRAILSIAGMLVAPATLPAELTGRPPVLLVHGEADDCVPPAASRLIERVLRPLGVPVSAEYLPGVPHDLGDGLLGAAGARLLRGVVG